METAETLKALHKRIAVMEDEKRARDAAVAEQRARVEREREREKERIRNAQREEAARMVFESGPAMVNHSSSYMVAAEKNALRSIEEEVWFFLCV
jgi:hypothetical protein